MIFDAALPGTTDPEWTTMGRLTSLPLLDVGRIERLTVVAAHPDDETLGAGGLISEASVRGIPVQVIVVTDGAASHPASQAITRRQLAVLRQRELFLAVAELAPEAEVVMLDFGDGETSEHRSEIRAALARAIEPGATIVAPWRGDGHRDHRIVGELCAELAAANEKPLLEYPIWMWHWAVPDDERVPWSKARSVPLSASSRRSKTRALTRYASQVVGVGDGEDDGPVLRPDFLDNFDRSQELFLIMATDPLGGSKSESYFDDLYERHTDPWKLGTRWYERRKRAITVASLPRARYRSALEIGCSVGELTASLATHCDALLAIDISATAVARASERTRDLGNVRVDRADARAAFPAGEFDLVVLSEVAYYWDRATLRHVVEELVQHLADDATVVVCHWRHPVADYPLSGDEANDAIREVLPLTRVAIHDEADFLLEVFTVDPRSVATHEGLVD